MNENMDTKVEKLRPFTRFCMTIGELPSSYLMSMSYYEQVLWFTKYLQETVIPAINTNATAVEEIQEFLKTLDLQDEVDKKLDEMATDGSLTNLIKDYVDPIYQEYETTINNSVNSLSDEVNDLSDELDTAVTSQNTTINQISNQMDVLSNRMDGFSSLPDGSTAGDAELEDVRVGFNGITHASAGNSVRSQATYDYDAINSLNNDLGYHYEQCILANGSITNAGNITVVNSSNYIPVNPNSKIEVITNKALTDASNYWCYGYSFYNSSKVSMGDIIYDPAITKIQMPNRPEVTYIRVIIAEYNPTNQTYVNHRVTDFTNNVYVKVIDADNVKNSDTFRDNAIDKLEEKSGYFYERGIIADGSTGSFLNVNCVNTANLIPAKSKAYVHVYNKAPLKNPDNYFYYGYTIYNSEGTNLTTYAEDTSRRDEFQIATNSNIAYIRLMIWEHDTANNTYTPIRSTNFSYDDVYVEVSYENVTANKLNKVTQEGQIYFDLDSKITFECDSDWNMYLYYTGGIRFRDSYFTGDLTLSQLTTILGDDYTATSPSGIAGCVKIPNVYKLVLDYDYSLTSSAIKIVNRNQVNANKYLPLIENVMGRVVKGLFKDEYESFMEQNYHVPTYWYGELSTSINSFKNNLKNHDGNFSNMFFITDYHIASNIKNSPKLIKYLANKLHIPLVLSGGDIVSTDYTNKLTALNEEIDFVSSFENGYINLFNTYGNHDFNYNGVNADIQYKLSQNQVYTAMINQINNCYKANTYNRDVMYYDNESEHLRVINFKCYEDNHNPQVDPIIKTAINSLVSALDNTWSIVFMTHSYWSANGEVFNVGGEYADYIASLSHTSQAKIICLLTGHTHKDDYAVVTAQNGGTLLVISTTTDALGQNTLNPDAQYTMTAQTDTEQAFDIIQIDKTNQHIYLTRVGAGNDRDYSY